MSASYFFIDSGLELSVWGHCDQFSWICTFCCSHLQNQKVWIVNGIFFVVVFISITVVISSQACLSVSDFLFLLSSSAQTWKLCSSLLCTVFFALSLLLTVSVWRDDHIPNNWNILFACRHPSYLHNISIYMELHVWGGGGGGGGMSREVWFHSKSCTTAKTELGQAERVAPVYRGRSGKRMFCGICITRPLEAEVKTGHFLGRKCEVFSGKTVFRHIMCMIYCYFIQNCRKGCVFIVSNLVFYAQSARMVLSGRVC